MVLVRVVGLNGGLGLETSGETTFFRARQFSGLGLVSVSPSEDEVSVSKVLTTTLVRVKEQPACTWSCWPNPASLT